MILSHFVFPFFFGNNYFGNGCASVFSFEQYLELMPLSVKSYHFEFIKTNGHNNAYFK